MNVKNITWIWLCGLAMTVGCDTRTIVGEVPDGSAPDGSNQTTSLDPVGTSGHTCAPPQFPGDHPFNFPAGVAGVWTGYVENAALGFTSDAVRLTLDQAADGTNQIHVAYGAAPPPPPATSATDLPPGLNGGNGGAGGVAGTQSVVEGFSYVAHNVDWQAFGQQWRLRFLVDIVEPWASWCRLQPSYATPSPGGVEYACLPNTGGGSISGPGTGLDGGTECWVNDSTGHKEKDVSCAQLQLCPGNFVCACDQCGCDMQPIQYDGVPTGPGIYDILFDTTSASGTSASGNNVHLLPAN